MNNSSEPQSKSSLYILLTGLGMGAADVVPGVSGGTVAFITGIYDQLLEAVKSVNLEFAKKLLRLQFKSAFLQIPWKFLLPLVGGIAIAILSLAKVLEFLLEEHKVHLMAFFFGLILASIVALAARMKWAGKEMLALVIGSVFAFWMVGLVPANPGHSAPILFGSGVLAISAMILPGLSGSFILLILGQYKHCVATLNQIIDALRAGDISTVLSHFFATVLPIGMGMVIGLMMFVRLLSWLLKSYRSVTVAVLIGCMIGSLRRIWPYREGLQFQEDRHGNLIAIEERLILPDTFDSSVLLAIGLLIAGFLFICLVDHIQDRKNPIAKLILPSRDG